MRKIILDCDQMKHRHSGLHQYCLNIGKHTERIFADCRGSNAIRFYVPAFAAGDFENKRNCIVEKKYHRVLKPFLWDCDIWHTPFQSGRMPPVSNGKFKVLLTIHDLNCLHEGKPVDEQQRSIAHTQRLIDRADAIVCISEFCKKDVLLHCNVSSKPVYVIHNGTHKLHEPLLINTSYKPRLPFLFGMGYVNRKKNFHVLLPMMKSNNYELVIAGKLDEPDYIHSMMQMAKELGIQDRVKLLGPVSETEKSWYLKNCFAYMHPSLAEGFGAPVVEAMSFGKPVFLSPYTSLPEIGGDAAFYFSSFNSDQMHTVFENGMAEYMKNGMAQKIINKGKEYNWEAKAREYINVYESLK